MQMRNQPLKRQGSPPYHLLARLETTEIRQQHTLHKPIEIRDKDIRNMRKRRIIQTAQLLMVPERYRLQRDMFVIIFSRNTLAKFKVEDRSQTRTVESEYNVFFHKIRFIIGFYSP